VYFLKKNYSAERAGKEKHLQGKPGFDLHGVRRINATEVDQLFVDWRGSVIRRLGVLPNKRLQPNASRCVLAPRRTTLLTYD
jgi:hypothetical protein